MIRIRGTLARVGMAGMAVAVGAWPPFVSAQSPAAWRGKDVKYVRDSEEYATLVRQIYRTAAQAVEQTRRTQRDTAPWTVVLDVDETALDNSAFELERETYGVPFDAENWNAYVARRQSWAVPGVQEFIAGIRAAGGRVAWITNRDEITREDTRENLRRLGLWADTDRLCLRTERAYTKAVRRREVMTGSGQCAWTGQPMRILAFVGDQLGDFPGGDEDIADAGNDDAFGKRFFIVPNPMYGDWLRDVTRRWPWQ